MSEDSVKFHEDKRHAVYARDGYKCHYCGYHDSLQAGVNLTIDHIKARNLGGAGQAGKTEPGTNLITACGPCNFSKGKKTPKKFNEYLQAKGKGPIDFDAVRKQARKPLDIAAGELGAARARTYRKAESERQAVEAIKAQRGSFQEKAAIKIKGPGIRHGNDGKFLPGGHARARTFSKALVDRVVSVFARLHGLTDLGWTFVTRLVPGLMHGEPPEPAWAVIRTDPATRKALIDVRDLAKTPLPGNWWEELKITLAHEVGHAQVDEYKRSADEEGFVERVARGLVAAGSVGLAREYARGVKDALHATPDTARARVWTKEMERASAYGGAMEPDQELVNQMSAAADALSAGEQDGGAKALDVIKKLLVIFAAKGASPGAALMPAEPPEMTEEPMTEPPMEAREEEDPMTDDPTKKKEPAPPMARAASMDAEVRARLAALDKANESARVNVERARVNADKTERAMKTASGIAIRGRLTESRARGVKMSAETEKLFASMTDIDAFEHDFKLYCAGQEAMSAAPERARVQPGVTPPSAGSGDNATVDVVALQGEGLNEQQIGLYAALMGSGQAEQADLFRRDARARQAQVIAEERAKQGAN